MVRRLILASAISMCVSSQCIADAVRKLHVVDPAQEHVKLAQRNKERLDLLKLNMELSILHSRIQVEFLRATDPATRRQLQIQIDELNKKKRQVKQLLKTR